MTIKEHRALIPKKACMEHVLALIRSEESLRLKTQDENNVILEKIDALKYPILIVEAGLSFQAIAKNETIVYFDVKARSQSLYLLCSGIVCLIFILMLLGSLMFPYFLYTSGIYTPEEFSINMRNSLFFLLFTSIIFLVMGISPLWRVYQQRIQQGTLFKYFVIALEELEDNIKRAA